MAGLAAAFTAAPATAGAPAAPGETFATSYLDLPQGSIPAGESGTQYSSAEFPAVSSDGRYVAFPSEANALSADANPNVTNIYRKDRSTGAVELVSRATGASGAAPNLPSYTPKISGNGNLVAFITDAALAPGDADSDSDLYIRDLTSKTTTLASPGTGDSVYEYSLSSNGLYAAFVTESALVVNDLNLKADVYRRNLLNGAVNLVSRIPASETAGNDGSYSVSVSGDGRWVAFRSQATNLVAGYVNNNGSGSEIFARDMTGGTTFLVSSRWNSTLNGSNGDNQEPVIAGTPQLAAEVRVAYASYATDLADAGISDPDTASSVYLRSLAIAPSTLISRATGVAGANANSRAHSPDLSDDGTRVVFSSDATNLGAGADYYGVYLRNTSSGATTLASARNEYAVQGSISGNGAIMVWTEAGGATPDSDPDAYGVYARTAPSGTIEQVSRPPGDAPFLLPGVRIYDSKPGTRVLSADGRYTVFTTVSSRLPGSNGRPQIYRRDLLTGEIELVSRATGANGAAAANGGGEATISADGSRIAFVSYTPLDPADPGTSNEVYLRALSTDTTTLISRADGPAGAAANLDVDDAVISGNGQRVAFSTEATNLGFADGHELVYVRDVAANQTILGSRADGGAGAAANGDSANGRLSGDGQVLVYESRANNLHPDDPDTSRDIYVRNLAGNQTILASRLEGLAGAKSSGFNYQPAISADGKVIAWETDDELIAPEAGPWPAGSEQIVSRVLATGANALVSRVAGGPPADQGADSATLDGTGSVIAFRTYSTNLIAGVGDSVEAVVARDSSTGALTGPPRFGEEIMAMISFGSYRPSLSDNGQCLGFLAKGHNEISGDLSDLDTAYVHVVSGSCSDPRAIPPDTEPPVPALSKVSLKPKKFAVGKKPTAQTSVTRAKKKKKKAPKGTKIRFTVNTGASVTIKLERKVTGRKSGGKCRKVTKQNKGKKKCSRFVKAGKLVRQVDQAGSRVVPFSGRVGKKKLKPGKYRAVLTGYNSTGASKKVIRPFTVLRR